MQIPADPRMNHRRQSIIEALRIQGKYTCEWDQDHREAFSNACQCSWFAGRSQSSRNHMLPGQGIFRLWMQGYRWYNGSICKRTCITFEEYPPEPPNIPHSIHGGESLCILQEDIPLWSCNGNNCAKSESEDLFHSNVLQPCKGKISWPDSVSYEIFEKMNVKNMVKQTMFCRYLGKIDWGHELCERYRVKVNGLGKPHWFIRKFLIFVCILFQFLK